MSSSDVRRVPLYQGFAPPINSITSKDYIDIVGSGARLPGQSLRGVEFPVATVAPGEQITLFNVKGRNRILFASMQDNSDGLMEYYGYIDNQSNIISSPFIWQIVGALVGIQPSGGVFSLSPTGFPASSFFSGKVTYLTASFATDASGNVSSESLVISEPYIYSLAEINIYAVNGSASDVKVGGYLVTQPYPVE